MYASPTVRRRVVYGDYSREVGSRKKMQFVGEGRCAFPQKMGKLADLACFGAIGGFITNVADKPG